MSTPSEVSAGLRRVQRAALGASALGLGVSAWGFTQDRSAFFQGWLVAFLFWIAIPLGSLALTMMHALTGGAWGSVIRRQLEAALRTLPLFVLLFVPIALGAHDLYEWTHADVVAADPILTHKAPYLNLTAFLTRAGLYFALWIALAFGLTSFSERAGDERAAARKRVLSGPGLVVLALSVTFASIDWAMSLEPHWFSTIYGVLFLVGQGLATLAFAIAGLAWLARHSPYSTHVKPGHFHDLGKLMFAYVLLWAYVNYSQFLIIWSANLAEEAPWYLRRTAGSWQGLALALVALHFVLPFAVLLSKAVKRNPRTIAVMALFLLSMRLVDLWWLILPAFAHADRSAHWHWLHLSVPIGVGGLWLASYVRQLASRPLLSAEDAVLHDPHGSAAAAASHH